MEKFIQKIEKCSKWIEVCGVFEEKISPEYISFLLEILNVFSITEPEIKDVIEKNLEQFLGQMKIVCFHLISTFFRFHKTEFFTIHVKWFYVIFVYFSLKKMVNQEMIVWTSFNASLNIQKMFIDALMKYEFELPLGFYGSGLSTNFRIILTFITSCPVSGLNGIGGVPDYINKYRRCPSCRTFCKDGTCSVCHPVSK